MCRLTLILTPDTKPVLHTAGVHLQPRLKRLWDFIRLQLHLHCEPTSKVGAHCLNLKLGSLAEPRFNNCCDHGDVGSAPALCPIVSEQCSHEGCDVASKFNCKHCATSFCAKHLEENICTQECLPKKVESDFVCRECSPNVERRCHEKEGCASCDEVEYFKTDLLKCAQLTGDEDIYGRAKDVCECVDIMVGHTARCANQERVPSPPPLTLTLILTPNPNRNVTGGTCSTRCGLKKSTTTYS